jgi:hypothetical protein
LRKCGAEIRSISAKIPKYPVATRLELVDKSCCRDRADNSDDVLYGKNKSNKLLLNINDNQLPGIYRMEHFLEKCRELFDNHKIAGDAYIDWLKKETFGY